MRGRDCAFARGVADLWRVVTMRWGRRSLAAACALPSGGGRRHKQARSQIAAFVVNHVVDKAAEATHSAHVLARSHLDLRRSDTVVPSLASSYAESAWVWTFKLQRGVHGVLFNFG